MNQKGFINIALVVLVIIVVGALGYVTLVKKPALSPTQEVTPITNNSLQNSPPATRSIVTPPKYTQQVISTTIKDFVCKARDREKDITNPTNFLVVESRQRIINLGVSARYFDNHFKLVCGKILRSGNPEITWRYTIGEFMVGISDLGTKFPSLALENTVGQLHEIQNVVTQEKALGSMQSCVGNFSSPGIAFGLIVDLPTSKQAGLYVVAQPTRKARSGFHEIAFVNLETGICKIVERGNPPPLP